MMESWSRRASGFALPGLTDRPPALPSGVTGVSVSPRLSQALLSLKLQGNQLVAVPPQEKWTCRQLKTLDLSRNQFGR